MVNNGSEPKGKIILCIYREIMHFCQVNKITE